MHEAIDFELIVEDSADAEALRAFMGSEHTPAILFCAIVYNESDCLILIAPPGSVIHVEDFKAEGFEAADKFIFIVGRQGKISCSHLSLRNSDGIWKYTPRR